MTVELGPYANTATELDVDVMLEAAGDAAATAPKHTALTLKPGAGAGGVEVQFPNGYQAGRKATIALTLLSGGAPLAEQVVTPVLPPGCGTLTVDFGASAAGSEGRAGGGGAGGGGAGEGGAAGAATGGAGGAATGGAGGAATGKGGAGGGKGGAGGAKGGAGGAATGGAGGAGGAACKATGAENCFDGIDNDCNGFIDCADSACGAAVAQCVALDPTAAPIGLLSGGTGPCSTALYDQATAIFGNQNQLSCTGIVAGQGCSCKSGSVSCSTSLAGFKTDAECTSGATGGEATGTFVMGQDKNCTAAGVPPWTLDTNGDIFGIGATTFVATPADCTASGTPNVPTYGFGTNATFCGTQKVGGGCGTGQVCVPASGSGGVCQLFNGAKTTCPGGAPAQPYYTGVSGTITCGACTCGSPVGASCDSLCSRRHLQTCSGGIDVQSNGRECIGSGVSRPAVEFSGTPTPGNCSPMSTLGGNAGPTGPKTLCCPQ